MMADVNEDSPLLQQNQPAADNDHHLTKSQKVILVVILLAELFNSATFYVAVVWFPSSLGIKSLFFTNIEDGWHISDGINARDNIVPALAIAILYLCSPIAGILADNFMKKSRALIAGLLLTAIMYSLLITEMSLFTGYTCVRIKPNNTEHCYYSNTSSIQTFCKISPVQQYDDKFRNSPLCFGETWIIVILLSVASSLIRTVLPALGGDQIVGEAVVAHQMQYAFGEPVYRHSVRVFYAAFYWMNKLAELVGALMAVIAAKRLSDPSDIPNEMLWKIILVDWIIVTTVFFVGTVVCILLITPRSKCNCLGTFEPNAQKSYIRDTVGIYRNAFKRRKEVHMDAPCTCLYPAMIENGGEYNRGLIQNRTKLAKLFMASVLLIPLAFVTNTCSLIVYSNMLLKYLKLDATSDTVLITMSYVPVFNVLTSVLSIPILHFIFNMIRKHTNHRPKLLWRIIAGHIMMMLSCSACVAAIKYSRENSSWSKTTSLALGLYAIPYVLLGLTNALVYTAGYEMTLTLSPRSSQCLSMGLFKMVDGIGTLLGIIPYFAPTIYQNPDNWIIVYIMVLLIGAVCFWLFDKKLQLGLRR